MTFWCHHIFGVCQVSLSVRKEYVGVVLGPSCETYSKGSSCRTAQAIRSSKFHPSRINSAGTLDCRQQPQI